MSKLTKRQQQILEFIRSEVSRKGYPPSVREIGEAVGLQSSSTVHGHLQRLEELGYIRRDPAKPRAIEVLDDDSSTMRVRAVHVPLVGRVTAGTPVLAVENIEEYYPIPGDFVEHEDVFLLRVQGDSMIEAGILDQDFVLVEKRPTADNGDIVVALVDGTEATVKRFFHEGSHIRLQPENASMSPIISTDVAIIGRVVGLFRRLR